MLGEQGGHRLQEWRVHARAGAVRAQETQGGVGRAGREKLEGHATCTG